MFKTFIMFKDSVIKPDGSAMNTTEIHDLIGDLTDLLHNTDTAGIEEYNERREKRLALKRHLLGTKERSSKTGFVYVAEGLKSQYKIGLSSDPDTRIKEYTKLPFEVKLVYLIKTFDMDLLEKHLHDAFVDKRIRGEWFSLEDADLKWIRKNFVNSIVFDRDFIE
jgi:hypothetical protein